MAAETYQGLFVQAGSMIDHTPAGAVSAGDVVVQGSLVGIAREAIAAGVLGTLGVAGIYNVVKITGAIAVGVPIYWDSTGDPLGGSAGTGAATATSGGNDYMGFAQVAAGGTDQVVTVYMVPAISVNTSSDLSAVITDPGDAGAIPVTGSGSCALVTAGAETRTLAAPTIIGQMISLYMKTDAGDCVVTCATFVNETGNNTITFDNTGEVLVLIAVEEGATKRWRTLLTDGAALSTV